MGSDAEPFAEMTANPITRVAVLSSTYPAVIDKAQFDDYAERLRSVNRVVKELDPALQPEAVKILTPYVTGGKTDAGSGQGGGETRVEEGSLDALRERLVTEHSDGSPSDNALLAIALWFAQYGKEPFAIDDVRETAKTLGVTIPDRPDAFIGTTKRNGKKLFVRARKGFYSPTVHGETFLKSTYGVSQGTAVLERE